MYKLTLFLSLVSFCFATSENLICRYATGPDLKSNTNQKGLRYDQPPGKKGEKGMKGDMGDAEGINLSSVDEELEAINSSLTKLHGNLINFTAKFEKSQSEKVCGKNGSISDAQCVYYFLRRIASNVTEFCHDKGLSLPMFTSDEFINKILSNVSSFFLNERNGSRYSFVVESQTFYKPSVDPPHTVFQPDGTNTTLDNWLPNYPSAEKGGKVWLWGLLDVANKIVDSGITNDRKHPFSNVTLISATVCAKTIAEIFDN